MKKTILLPILMLIAQSAFSMTNTELTGKMLSDKTFIQSVETSIKNIFRYPQDVKMNFISAGVVAQKSQKFLAEFQYHVKAKNVTMGNCSFTFLGQIQPDSTLKFEKMHKEDCGE